MISSLSEGVFESLEVYLLYDKWNSAKKKNSKMSNKAWNVLWLGAYIMTDLACMATQCTYKGQYPTERM